MRCRSREETVGGEGGGRGVGDDGQLVVGPCFEKRTET